MITSKNWLEVDRKGLVVSADYYAELCRLGALLFYLDPEEL